MVDAVGPGSVRKCPGAALADLGDVEGFDRSGEEDQLYAFQLSDGKISFVWSVVKTSDVVVYGWKTLSSYRGEPLTMQRLSSPPRPCPGHWPAASGSSTPHLITVLSSALAGQKSVQTFCMRRHSSIVSASSSTVAARHSKSSRRGIKASGPFPVLPIGATFLSSFQSLRPVLQCMRGLSIMSSTS